MDEKAGDRESLRRLAIEVGGLDGDDEVLTRALNFVNTSSKRRRVACQRLEARSRLLADSPGGERALKAEAATALSAISLETAEEVVALTLNHLWQVLARFVAEDPWADTGDASAEIIELVRELVGTAREDGASHALRCADDAKSAREDLASRVRTDVEVALRIFEDDAMEFSYHCEGGARVVAVLMSDLAQNLEQLVEGVADGRRQGLRRKRAPLETRDQVFTLSNMIAHVDGTRWALLSGLSAWDTELVLASGATAELSDSLQG